MRTDCVFAVKLSPRLEAMAKFVPPGAGFADIGTDHALLPIYLAQRELVSKAIGTEVTHGPYTAATRNVRAAGLAERVDIRLGDGLAPIRPGEVSTINISGMGGGTMVGILTRGYDVVQAAQRLVLQPMNAGDAIRRFLYERRIYLVSEEVQVDEGRSYELLVAEMQSTSAPDPCYRPFETDTEWLNLAFLFGPTLLTNPSGEFVDRVRATADHMKYIVTQLDASTQAEAVTRHRQLGQQLKRIYRWLDKYGLKG